VPETLADATRSAGPFPATEYILGKSRGQRVSRADAESLMVRLTDSDAAPGALIGLGAGATPGRVVYRAAPVHLRPDRDRLLLFAGDALSLSEAEATAICRDFNRTFLDDGLELGCHAGEWILQADAAPGPDLPALSAVAGRYLDMVIPDDTDSRPWRRLLNVVQMFLFDHPVNRAREDRGEPAVNGLWFWAGGQALQGAVTSAVKRIIGDDPLAGAMARTLGVSRIAPDQADAGVPHETNHTVIVWADAERALLGGDVEAWLASLQRFEATWAPWLRDLALHTGRPVMLSTGNGRDFILGPGARRRLWRRIHPLGEWIERQ
jgi:hypothetical protein